MGTNSSSEYPLLDQLADEFAARYRRGERPSLKEYADKYPHLAEEICELFPALVEMERVDEDRQEAVQQDDIEEAPPLRQVGDYSILREIGHGGMGVVYEAEQQSLGRRVALKILSHHAAPDAKTLARFRREAKAAARLHHTNIVPVFEVGQEGKTCYYAMQLIPGQSLEQIIEELSGLRLASVETTGHNEPAEPSGESACPRRGSRALSQAAQSLLTGRFEPRPTTSASPLPNQPGDVAWDAAPTEAAAANAPSQDKPQTAKSVSATQVAVLPGQAEFTRATASHRHYFRSVAQLGHQAAAALAYAHLRGVIHRDIKPSNLLLDLSGVVWITDFGLAKSEDDGLTRTGEMPGTLRYMSPERFRGECDERADVYGLGLTLYEMLVLKPAFDAHDRMQLIERIGHEEPARPRSMDGQVPLDLETIVLKAIDKEPRRRYQSAEEMAEDLRRFASDEPIRARRASLPERVARWCRRNRTVAGLMAAVMATLLLGTFVATFFAVKADANARQAEANEKQAKDEKREANLARDRAITALSVSVWLEDKLEDRIQALARDDPWDKALAVVRDVRLREPDNAAAVLVSARLCWRYADSLRKQGQVQLAARMDQESREFYEKLLALQADHALYAGEYASFLLSRLERTQANHWEILEPRATTSVGGTTLTRQPDNSILASGKNPLTEIYTISARSHLPRITAVRLEVVPDPSFPQQGSGRADNGNFCLNEIYIVAAAEDDPHKARPVVLHKAWADFSQGGYPVAGAIDGNLTTGWAVMEEAERPHTALFELKESLVHANGANLTFTLYQQYQSRHNMGRFRLSVTEGRDEALWKERCRACILRLAPVDGWTKLGAALYLRGEWRSALEVLLKSTATPSGGNCWDRLLLAQIHNELGHREVAGKWFDAMFTWIAEKGADGAFLHQAGEGLSDLLAHEPQKDNVEVHIGRARAFLELKQPDKALAEASKAVEFHHKSVAARQARGEIYVSLKKWDAALGDYNELVELKPSDAGLLNLRAMLAARCGKHAAAAEDLAKLTQKEAPEAPSSYLLWYRHALTLLATGKKEEYQKACARMLEQFKETASTQAAFFTAWTAALGPDAIADFSPAFRLAQKATEQDAKNPQSHQAVGAILYRMGRLEKCLSHFDAAQAAANPQNQTSSAYLDYFRAMAHHRLGRKEEARQHLQWAVAQTDKELRDDAQTSDLNNWVRKATLQLLRAEAEAVLRKPAAGREN